MASTILGVKPKPIPQTLLPPQGYEDPTAGSADYAPLPVGYEKNQPGGDATQPVDYGQQPADPTQKYPSYYKFDESTGQYYDPTALVDTRQAAYDASQQPASGGAAPASGGDWWSNPNVDPFAAVGGGTFVNGQWFPASNTAAQQASTPQAGAAAGTVAGGATGAAGATPQTIEQAKNSALLGLLQTPQDVSSASVDTNPAMRAYKLQAQRAEERQRAALAEKASYEGWDSSGAFDTSVQGLAQQRGEGEAGYAGQLALIQMEDQKERLIQGINFAIQTGDAASARTQQMQLAQLQAQLDREHTGFNYTQLQTQANRDATLALLAGV